jgi:hypothetical protein
MVRDGKGGKARRVMLPQSPKPRLLEQTRETLRCLKRGIENWAVLPPDKDGRVRLVTRSVTATLRLSRRSEIRFPTFSDALADGGLYVGALA